MRAPASYYDALAILTLFGILVATYFARPILIGVLAAIFFVALSIADTLSRREDSSGDNPDRENDR